MLPLCSLTKSENVLLVVLTDLDDAVGQGLRDGPEDVDVGGRRDG